MKEAENVEQILQFAEFTTVSNELEMERTDFIFVFFEVIVIAEKPLVIGRLEL